MIVPYTFSAHRQTDQTKTKFVLRTKIDRTAQKSLQRSSASQLPGGKRSSCESSFFSRGKKGPRGDSNALTAHQKPFKVFLLPLTHHLHLSLSPPSLFSPLSQSSSDALEFPHVHVEFPHVHVEFTHVHEQMTKVCSDSY